MHSISAQVFKQKFTGA